MSDYHSCECGYFHRKTNLLETRFEGGPLHGQTRRVDQSLDKYNYPLPPKFTFATDDEESFTTPTMHYAVYERRTVPVTDALGRVEYHFSHVECPHE